MQDLGESQDSCDEYEGTPPMNISTGWSLLLLLHKCSVVGSLYLAWEQLSTHRVCF
jgi:hypothetical protein